ncbi:hypothetical protein EDB86DRAFT_2245440 [Lactarius hatsudake]|nr:hypothetical protein EDB86DRAFT_2245440 [Lactarius hatsudake]
MLSSPLVAWVWCALLPTKTSQLYVHLSGRLEDFFSASSQLPPGWGNGTALFVLFTKRVCQLGGLNDFRTSQGYLHEPGDDVFLFG